MIILSVINFLLLVSDATGITRVNTTVGKSTILPCLMNNTITNLIFESRGTMSEGENNQICQMTLHVAAPYEDISLAVYDKVTAVCTAQKGFPESSVSWRLQQLNKSQHFLASSDVQTTAEQDPKDHLYRLRSTIQIHGGPYLSATCLIHNPTLNATQSHNYTLNHSGAERGPPALTAVLMMAAVLLWI
ncbi:hypothetical protein PBY51_022896 [Eleginops maclovinus]|uniref:Uncharacterized protein n=1 Tax=Eleginops maclovinus TaxID=56733 RepID=A0AAN7XKR4_ELEMC|nr:hypothetical protein PBY51_022896 [Eleginops maclovinus]